MRADAPGANDVDVWPFRLDVGPARLQELRRWLSADERQRADRFHFSRDRDRFVSGRGRVREILGRYLCVSPDTVRFAYGPQGKPRLADAAGLRFNVSHAEDEAVLAVARGREVGVDIERLRTDMDWEPIARRFFSPREAEALLALPPPARPPAFFAGWTRKEAFIKAVGGGLDIPLADFDVSLDPAGPARLLRTGWDPEEAGRWSLQAIQAPPGFAAAIAVQGGPPRLHAVRVSPPRPRPTAALKATAPRQRMALSCVTSLALRGRL